MEIHTLLFSLVLGINIENKEKKIEKVIFYFPHHNHFHKFRPLLSIRLSTWYSFRRLIKSWSGPHTLKCTCIMMKANEWPFTSLLNDDALLVTHLSFFFFIFHLHSLNTLFCKASIFEHCGAKSEEGRGQKGRRSNGCLLVEAQGERGPCREEEEPPQTTEENSPKTRLFEKDRSQQRCSL